MRTTKIVSCLILVLVGLPPSGAWTASPPTDEGPRVSPDGVDVYDFTRDSSVWVREFSISVPSDEMGSERVGACDRTPLGSMNACFGEIVTSARWIVPSPAPDLPIQLLATAEAQSIVLETGRFVIEDDVDPYSNHAEGYVVFRVEFADGQYKNVPVVCLDQSVPSGKCDAATTETSIAHDGRHTAWIKFWDMDDSTPDESWQDDQMDIADLPGAATVQITIHGGKWYANEDDHPPTCQAVAEGAWCYLDGTQDATGDHDDAKLNFMADVV